MVQLETVAVELTRDEWQRILFCLEGWACHEEQAAIAAQYGKHPELEEQLRKSGALTRELATKLVKATHANPNRPPEKVP